VELPVMPPAEPMLARSAARIPPDMHYEGKWDGFRAIVFRDGEEVEIGSRTGKSLTRYFPELVTAFRAGLPPRCVIDGEIVIVTGPRLDFDRLLDRIHPAESRVRMLAEQTPASFIAFDLLALAESDITAEPLTARRPLLEEVFADVAAPLHLAPATRDRSTAEDWLARYEGAGLDGVIAKRLDDAYRPGERSMVKIKHERTADCVLAGFRWHKSGAVVGSLMLGLYDDSGVLQYAGVSSSFPMKRRAELVNEVAPFRVDEDPSGHPWAHWQDEQAQAESRLPGGQTRWNAGKDLSWVPLRPEQVVEVRYDHMQGHRFRHTTNFKRWRPDRDPASCTYDQLFEPVRFDLADILGP